MGKQVERRGGVFPGGEKKSPESPATLKTPPWEAAAEEERKGRVGGGEKTFIAGFSFGVRITTPQVTPYGIILQTKYIAHLGLQDLAAKGVRQFCDTSNKEDGKWT